MTKRNTYIMVSHVVRPDGSNELRGVHFINVMDVIDLLKYRLGATKFNIHYGDETNGKFLLVVDETEYASFDDFDDAIEHLIKNYLREGKCVRKFGKAKVHIDVYYDFDDAEIEGISKFDGEDFDMLRKLLDEKSFIIGGTFGLFDETYSEYTPVKAKKVKKEI